MAEVKDVRWGLAQRFEFMEWRAFWVGHVNRKDLEDQFQISTPQASLDFRSYQHAAPGNIEYNATEKTYVVTADFRPKFLTLSPERYLLQLQALNSEAIRKSDTWFDQLPNSDAIPAIARGPEAYTLRAILKTIEMRGAIKVNYHSLTKKEVRLIHPHALAHDGYRWHVRALSVDHQEYRDYVLGRILSVFEPEECGADSSDDIAWNSQIKLIVIAHPELNPDQKATIEHDFRMKNGELEIEMRLALAFYFIKRHNLDLRNPGQIEPARAQLFLRNYTEVVTALEDAKLQSGALVAARVSRLSNL